MPLLQGKEGWTGKRGMKGAKVWRGVWKRAKPPSTRGPKPSLGEDSGIQCSLTGQWLREHPANHCHPQVLADTARANADARVSPGPRMLIYSIFLESCWILLTQKEGQPRRMWPKSLSFLIIIRAHSLQANTSQKHQYMPLGDPENQSLSPKTP